MSFKINLKFRLAQPTIHQHLQGIASVLYLLYAASIVCDRTKSAQMGQLSYCCCCCWRCALYVLVTTARAHLAPPPLCPHSLILIYSLFMAKNGLSTPAADLTAHSRKLIFPGNFTHCKTRAADNINSNNNGRGCKG